MSYCFCFVRCWFFFLTLNQTKGHHTWTYVIAQEKQKDLPAHVLQTSLVRRLPAVIQPLNWCFSNPEVFSTRRFPARRLNSISSVFYTQACRRYKSLHARKLPWIGFIEEIMCFHLNAFQRNFLVCVISVFVAPCFLNPGPAKVCVRGLVLCFYIKKKKSKETRATGPLHILNYNITVQLWCWHGCNTF